MNGGGYDLAAVAAATLAAAGSGLVWSSVFGHRAPRRGGPLGIAAGAWSRLLGSVGAGTGGPSASELALASASAAAGGAVAAFLLFGAVVPAALAALLAAPVPAATFRYRAGRRAEVAAEEWPRVLEEIRLRSGSLGRSVPQALFEAGRSVPAGWRPAFAAAEREWLLTVDLARTLDLLKSGLDDPTADVVCETLLMAHEVGGSDLDTALAELIEDRTIDVQNRKDAASRLAGVRFARRFVLLVPAGMTLAGLTIGSGRSAYETAGGQAAAAGALLAVAACWWWSGRLMRLPRPLRVFR